MNEAEERRVIYFKLRCHRVNWRVIADGLPKLHFGQRLKYRYGASGDFVIHSNTLHEVIAVTLGMNPPPEAIPDDDIIVEYEISAEDCV